MIIISAADFECQHIQKKNHTFLTCGIGPIESARRSLDIGSVISNQDVLFVGSCGIFESFKKPQIVTTHEVFWLPTCERLGFSEAIENITPPIFFSKPSHISKSIPSGLTICCPNISNHDHINDHIYTMYNIPKDSILLENLELYSLASVLDKAKTVSVLFVVTNQVGSKGRAQWKSFYQESYQLLGQYISSHF